MPEKINKNNNLVLLHSFYSYNVIVVNDAAVILINFLFGTLEQAL